MRKRAASVNDTDSAIYPLLDRIRVAFTRTGMTTRPGHAHNLVAHLHILTPTTIHRPDDRTDWEVVFHDQERHAQLLHEAQVAELLRASHCSRVQNSA